MLTDARHRGGTDFVKDVLDSSDVREHNLSKISAEVMFAITKDVRMGEEILTCKAPRGTRIAPDSKIAQARDLSKALYQQAQRTGGRGLRSGAADDSEEEPSGRRRRRNRRGAKGDAAKDDGAAKGGAAKGQ